jgi:hypothetical protein
MAIEAGLLPWTIEDNDPDIEACVKRWAAGWTKYGNDDISTDADIDADIDADTIAAGIINFMSERQTWEGTAAELFAELDGVVASPESLGHWLGKRKNLRQLEAAHIEVSKTRDETPKRTRLIHLEKIAQ